MVYLKKIVKGGDWYFAELGFGPITCALLNGPSLGILTPRPKLASMIYECHVSSLPSCDALTGGHMAIRTVIIQADPPRHRHAHILRRMDDLVAARKGLHLARGDNLFVYSIHAFAARGTMPSCPS